MKKERKKERMKENKNEESNKSKVQTTASDHSNAQAFR